MLVFSTYSLISNVRTENILVFVIREKRKKKEGKKKEDKKKDTING